MVKSLVGFICENTIILPSISSPLDNARQLRKNDNPFFQRRPKFAGIRRTALNLMGGDHWGQADVFIVANIAERCLNFGCFDLAKTNYDEPLVRNTA